MQFNILCKFLNMVDELEKKTESFGFRKIGPVTSSKVETKGS